MLNSNNLSFRKAKRRIRVTDGQGNPVSNSILDVMQTNHSFLFGCNGFDFLPYVLNPLSEKQLFFQEKAEKWLEVFNFATLPFYWGTFEPKEGEPRTLGLMKTAQYLKEHNVRLKGHPLCWHTVCADWLLPYDNVTIMKKQLERIDREVSGFKGIIDMWDVINEVVIMPVFDKYDNAVTRLCKEKGQVELVKEVFRRAKANNPEATLLLNDFNTSEEYERLIDGCLDAGIPISAIGIQSHQHQGYWGTDKLYDVLERFSRFGLPLHFTENTLLSGDLIPPEIEDLNDFQVTDWPSTPEGEERQKKEMEEMYRILFATPLVQAVTGWDFGDGAWLNAPSGIVRKDNSTKPAYEMLKKLIHEEWMTRMTVRTDENGYTELEGFLGDYKMKYGNLYSEFELAKGDDTLNIQMI